MEKNCFCESCRSRYKVSWTDVSLVRYNEEYYEGDDDADELEPVFCAFCGSEIDEFCDEDEDDES